MYRMARGRSSDFDFGEELFSKVTNVEKVADIEKVAEVADVADIANVASEKVSEVAEVGNVANVANITDVANVSDVTNVTNTNRVANITNLCIRISDKHRVFITLYSRYVHRKVKEIIAEWIADGERCENPANVLETKERTPVNFRVEVSEDIKERFYQLADESFLAKGEYLWWLIEKHRLECETQGFKC